MGTTTIVVADGIGATLLPPQSGAAYVPDRRRRRLRPYVGRERRQVRAPRLERRDGGLAVVRTCAACGRVSVVPWRPGEAVAVSCPCETAAHQGLSRQSLVVAWSLAFLWLLNLADVALTHKLLSAGAIEANVVVEAFLRLGFFWGAAIKVAFVTAGVLFLWHERRRRLVYRGAVVVTVIYALVVVYELMGLRLLA